MMVKNIITYKKKTMIVDKYPDMTLKEIREARKLKNITKAKNHYEKNKNKIKERRKEYRLSINLKYYVIYCIPNYDGRGGNYAGVTKIPKERIAWHKSTGKLNTEDWFILDVKLNPEEARISELEFHKKGYEGINKGMFKKKV